MYITIGGCFKAFILPECSLFFHANNDIYNLAVDLSNYLIVGRLCLAVPSVLWIDILNKFDILFSDDLERLFLTRSNIQYII
jgi:hypothetical protein